MRYVHGPLIFAMTFMLVGVAPAIAADNPNGASLSAVSIPAPAAQKTPPEDPIESLRSAIKADQAGRYGEALKDINEAKKGISAKHFALYRALLPTTPGPAWKSVDTSDTLSKSIVTREYTANGQTVSISYIIDPTTVKFMSGALIKMVGSMMAGASDEPLAVKGHKASYQEIKLGDIVNHKLTIDVGDVLVTVQSPTISKDTLLKFADLVDYEKLKAD